MKTLVCTVGLPRSGKTTWALSTPFPVIHPPTIRQFIQGKTLEPIDSLVWSILITTVNYLFNAGHNCIVVDGCHTTYRERVFWRNYSWTTRFMVMRVGENICLSRTEDPKVKDFISKLARNYEPLCEDELVFYG